MKAFRIFLFCLSLIPSLFAATPEYRSMGPDIFNPKAPGEELIAEARIQAGREKKKVLILFGANWCPWCRRLHVVLTKDPAVQERLKQNFVLVFVDANTRNDRTRNAAVIEKYGNPLQHGLPVFVILDHDGQHLGTQETASLAADTDAQVAARVLKFLGQWGG